MIRELARLACLGLERGDRVAAFVGGGVGGAVGFWFVYLATQRYPERFVHLFPH